MVARFHGSSRPLHRLIYCSRVSAGLASRLDEEVDAIVAVSVRNNAKAEVTGMLLAHDGWFLQVLEGRSEAVMTTYGRILNDRRHCDTAILESGPCPERLFGQWAMCARRIGAADRAVLDTLTRKGPFEPTRLSAAAALRLLQTVAGVKARIAA